MIKFPRRYKWNFINIVSRNAYIMCMCVYINPIKVLSSIKEIIAKNVVFIEKKATSLKNYSTPRGAYSPS